MHRVRSLELGGSFGTSDFLEALGLSLPTAYMFSNLDSLKWSPQSPPESDSVFHHIRLFLTPDITSLTLYGIKTVSDLSTLSNLVVRCPSLRNVCLGLHAIDVVQEISRISTFVYGLKHIESLTVPTLDDIALCISLKLPA
jgi:hypothetical protein